MPTLPLSGKRLLMAFSLLALAVPAAFAQLDAAHSDLCQGNYYTEPQAAQVLHNLQFLYHDRATWQQRAILIRQGILDGAELNHLPKMPLVVLRTGIHQESGYTVENIAIETLELAHEGIERAANPEGGKTAGKC